MSVLSCFILLAFGAGTYAQNNSSPSTNEYRAVRFGTDENENTKKLNDLAADGWEYVGPLVNSMVAFKRSWVARQVHFPGAGGAGVWGLDSSPDGKYCVAAVGDAALNNMKVQLFDLSTGALVKDLSSTAGDYVVNFANNGEWIVHANYNGGIKVVETATGKEVRRIQTETPLWNAVSLGSGKYATVISSKTVQICNLATGKELHRCKFAQDKFLWTASVDGKHFYYSVDGTVPFRALNLETGKEEPIRIKSLVDKKSFSFLDGGRHLVKQGVICTVHDTTTGKELTRLDLSKYVKGSRDWKLTPDLRSVLVVYKDHSLVLWDIAMSRELFRFKIDGPYRDWSISPDGRHAVVATTAGSLYFLRLPTVQMVAPSDPEKSGNK